MNDKLTSANRNEVAKAAMTVVNGIQHADKHSRVAGAAVAFVLLAERMNLRPSDLYDYASRVMVDGNAGFGRAKQFAAITDYLNNEV